jgi:hypothetical protein
MRVCSMLPIVALATVVATISVSCTMTVSSGTSSEMQKLKNETYAQICYLFS